MRIKTSVVGRGLSTTMFVAVLLLIPGCSGQTTVTESQAPSSVTTPTLTITSSTPPSVRSTETTSGVDIDLPEIPDMFPRSDEAECEWEPQILGSWCRETDGQVETVTFREDNTLFFTYGNEPNRVRVGTYIGEQGGTLALFSLMYVGEKPEQMLNLRRIEISFPSPDALVMDVKPANVVWTYERVD